MIISNRIEERLNSVLIIDKLNNPNRFSKMLSAEIENLLGDFMVISGKPVVDVLVTNDGKYKIQIQALASELKSIN